MDEPSLAEIEVHSGGGAAETSAALVLAAGGTTEPQQSQEQQNEEDALPSNAVRGVETNAESRFVDYTMATPWEQLVAEIERAVKQWVATYSRGATTAAAASSSSEVQESPTVVPQASKKEVELQYLEEKFRLVLVDISSAVEQSQRSSAIAKLQASSSVYQMMQWFVIERCILLSPAQSAAIPSPSARRLVYSATVCALESCGCAHLPVFVASAAMDALHRAREILGYSLQRRLVAPSTMVEQDLEHELVPITNTAHQLPGVLSREAEGVYSVTYESALLEGVAPKHDLFYLDGLLRLLSAKVADFTKQTIDLKSLWGFVQASESYFYRISENDKFLTKSVNFHNDTKKFRLQPEIQSVIEDLVAGIPDRDEASATLNKLVMRIDYGKQRLSKVVDNQYCTSLHPSSLPCEQWHVDAEFMPLRNRHDLEPQGLAFCLRQLLAFYIAGKCCEKGHTVVSMSGKKGPTKLVDRARALSAAAVLSMRSRDAVSAVCSPPPADFVDETSGLYSLPPGGGPPSVMNIPQDLLMRVFSRSLWVDAPVAGGHDNRVAVDPVTLNDLAALGGALPPAASSSASTAAAAAVGGSSGAALSPWQWMACTRAAPVGSWLNLVALYTGSLPDYLCMTYFWAECCHELRVHWENSVPVPRLHPPQPISANGTITPMAVSATNPKAPLWRQLLWDDVLDAKAAAGMHFSLPDIDRCLILQKLQVMQMCILCDNENSVVSCPTKQESASVLRSGAPLVAPSLQRRLPPTSDLDAHNQYLMDKVSNSKNRSAVDNPILKYQIIYPSIVSDARAFKAANPSSNFDDFRDWYEASDVSQEVLEGIWETCTPSAAEEQRPLFKASQEAEKAMSYLENLTPLQLASEMLCSAMTSVHMLLSMDLTEPAAAAVTTPAGSDASDVDAGAPSSGRRAVIAHRDLLEMLQKEIEIAVDYIREDAPQQGGSAESFSQHALLAVDRVCATVQFIEETKARADSCKLLFGEFSRLRDELGRSGHATAVSMSEAKHLFQLAKNASRGGSHSWHSYDGRELGSPDVKTFEVLLYPDLDASGQAIRMGSVNSAVVNTPTADDSATAVGTVDTVPIPSADRSAALQLQQRMHAIVSGEDLRVSLSLMEPVLT